MKNRANNLIAILALSVSALPAMAGNNLSGCLAGGEILVCDDTLVRNDTLKEAGETGTLFLSDEEVVYTPVEMSGIPEKVLTAVAARYAGYGISGAAEGSDGSYRLLINLDGSELVVYFTGEGEFLREELKGKSELLVSDDEVVYTEIGLDEVPDEVSGAVGEKYPGSTLTGAARGSDGSYRLVLALDGREVHVRYTAAGELVEEEVAEGLPAAWS